MTTRRRFHLLAPLVTLLLVPVTTAARADEVGFGSAAVGDGTLSIQLASHRSHSQRSHGRYDHRRGGHYRYDKHFWKKHKHHDRGYRRDQGHRYYGPTYRGHGHRGHGNGHFEIPRAIHRHGYHPYRDYYHGRVYYRGHGHYHDVYRFPVYSGYRVDYRPYAYCDGGFFASGYFGLRGPVFSIGIGF